MNKNILKIFMVVVGCVLGAYLASYVNDAECSVADRFGIFMLVVICAFIVIGAEFFCKSETDK